ncbi:hypothetical protein Pan216_36050 [Planctomycetes bacterium Pan216]|uniref:Uncharacterized protein n=1 Tax=Kolteria novifilia TaxID=2527975 RepID=A0A518B6Y5_9BACT|nr:hypothetical protein Pan216_36050 [Planctomycetes bacterium Pan216]
MRELAVSTGGPRDDPTFTLRSNSYVRLLLDTNDVVAKAAAYLETSAVAEVMKSFQFSIGVPLKSRWLHR